MLCIALMAALWLLAAGAIIRSEGWPDEAVSWILGIFMSGLTFAVSILIGGGIASGIGSILPTQIDREPSHRAALVTLRSSDGISGAFHGSFFLGVGTIGSQLFYFWYESEAGGITPRQIAAGRGTYVYEEDRSNGEVRVYGWHFQQSWWRWFAFEREGQTYEFHVPKGTVKQGYSL